MPFAGVGGTSVRFSQYLIDNSLRFNDNDSAYLSRTPSGSGTTGTWTFSCWVKRGVSSTNNFVIFSSGAVNQRGHIYLYSDNFIVQPFNSTGASAGRTTEAVFRDHSAWYHFLAVANGITTANLATNLDVYVNGIEVSTIATGSGTPTGGDRINDGQVKMIGQFAPSSGSYFDGYMAEMHLIDGQVLSPTDFGEFDSDSGIWKPIEYTGTYGTNGFYLDFENSGSLGADQSGNGNNFTPTNFTATDQTTDTPTNNFATLSPLLTDTNNTTFSEGNCKNVNTNASSAGASIAVDSGKWYCEMICTAKTATNAMIGISTVDGFDGERQADESQNGGIGYIYVMNGNISQFNATGGGAVSYGATWAVNDVIGMALDLDSVQNTITFYKNGVSQGAHNINDREYVFTNSNGQGGGSTITYSNNFGNPPHSISSGNSDENGYGNFEYAPPSGYLALCTQNLATALSPTIDDGSAYFQTLTFTGNGGTQTLTFDGNSDLQADFMWFKERNLAANWHQLWDTSRGATVASSKRFYSNASSADDNITTGAGVRGVGTNTVEVGATAGINGSSQPLVLWAWKANGGTTSSNTDGSITSTVQANTTAGFSIVTYTGTGSNATVGHGLGVKPDMVIVKGRSSTENWGVQMANTLGFTNALRLNLTDAYGGVNGAGWWNDIAPTSTTVSIGTRSEVNTNGNNYIMYCFNNVEGYSKFGSYTGNGSTDGTFVYTGFRPSWIMLKRTDSGASWLIFDNKRVGYNLVSNRLYANDPQGEDTSTSSSLDLLSNGFKIRSTTAGDSSTNASGGTYIYMAFAENPFVTSTGIPVVAR